MYSYIGAKPNKVGPSYVRFYSITTISILNNIITAIAIVLCVFSLACCVLGSVYFSIAVNKHLYGNSYDIASNCSVISYEVQTSISCDFTNCYTSYSMVYYFKSLHKQCSFHYNSISTNVTNTTNTETDTFEIVWNKQLSDDENIPYAIGDYKKCYTNDDCDGVFFDTLINKHHISAMGAIVIASIFYCVGCCFCFCMKRVSCAYRMQLRSFHERRFQYLSVFERYHCCVELWARKNNILLPKDIQKLIIKYIKYSHG